MSIKFYLIVLLCFISNIGFAKVYQTQRSGAYTDSFSWLNNQAPGLTSSDTILIKDFIDLSNTMTLKSGAYMEIDTGGRLCGHQTATIESGARLISYGILQLDSLQVYGGNVEVKGPGTTIFTRSVILQIAGASFKVSGSRVSVGPWFVCANPQQDGAVKSFNKKNALPVFPNPCADKIQFQIDPSLINQPLVLYDMNGKIIFETMTSSERMIIDVSQLPNGIYWLQILAKQEAMQQQIISIQH